MDDRSLKRAELGSAGLGRNWLPARPTLHDRWTRTTRLFQLLAGKPSHVSQNCLSQKNASFLAPLIPSLQAPTNPRQSLIFSSASKRDEKPRP
ncbi:hypothetical protein HZ326_20244 [Fusarium oxysporum f. sp. albedinis]|nr:hypothetical protein HZ326_20244 [Fusarium oxysporum f. sp. albedinis]